jgi:hypothetical protein
MIYFRRFLAKFRGVFNNGQVESDLEREINAHLGLLEEDFLRKGMSAEEARRAARRAYGGVEQAKQLHRDERAPCSGSNSSARTFATHFVSSGNHRALLLWLQLRLRWESEPTQQSLLSPISSFADPYPFPVWIA